MLELDKVINKFPSMNSDDKSNVSLGASRLQITKKISRQSVSAVACKEDFDKIEQQNSPQRKKSVDVKSSLKSPLRKAKPESKQSVIFKNSKEKTNKSKEKQVTFAMKESSTEMKCRHCK